MKTHVVPSVFARKPAKQYALDPSPFCFNHLQAILYSILFFDSILLYCTSSTAQGGGGNFKNRKPIGEVGCCESGMAERSD